MNDGSKCANLLLYISEHLRTTKTENHFKKYKCSTQTTNKMIQIHKISAVIILIAHNLYNPQYYSFTAQDTDINMHIR